MLSCFWERRLLNALMETWCNVIYFSTTNSEDEDSEFTSKPNPDSSLHSKSADINFRWMYLQSLMLNSRPKHMHLLLFNNCTWAVFCKYAHFQGRRHTVVQNYILKVFFFFYFSDDCLLSLYVTTWLLCWSPWQTRQVAVAVHSDGVLWEWNTAQLDRGQKLWAVTENQRRCTTGVSASRLWSRVYPHRRIHSQRCKGENVSSFVCWAKKCNILGQHEQFNYVHTKR